MDVRKLILLVGALLVAGVTAFMARSMFSGGGAAVAAPAPVEPIGNEVLVAAKPLPLGTIIVADMLVFQPWPKDMVEKAYFLKGTVDPATLVGKVVRHTVMAGQPVAHGALIGPGENGFLAAALGPGMRATTISLSDTSGIAGFLFPGDRVDVILTQEVSGDGPSLRTSETIVRNLRVLAVDQRMDDTSTEAKVGRTATLEVTPKLAEKITVAEKIGTLSLSLRSIADNAAELERAIAAGEVNVDGNDAAADRALELAVARMPSDVNPTYTTGGEVSRFQRSSMPSSKSSDDGGDKPAPAVAAARPAGPVVRVARGKDVSTVSVGGR
ncbi:Flp pilus assembly protein CpaB [Sphingoaurantiacus capsulatus]|uniref:Flp pilus assembly protein CpaB n=1 Tax=Sphingoaurantiacus capsulatus TaxID=1771310 RepID=A0ABV7X8A4_9SPHN